MCGYDKSSPKFVTFTLGGMEFEYDEAKNQQNIDKHGISFMNAARVFFDYDRIEFYAEEHSCDKTDMIRLEIQVPEQQPKIGMQIIRL